MKYQKAKLFIFSILFLFSFPNFAQKVTLSGYVKDAKNGEELIGVSVYVKQLGNGVISNPYGFYSLTLPKGKYTILYSFVGYQTLSQEIDLQADQALNIQLQDEAVQLQAVEVVAEKEDEDKNIQAVSMSRNEVNVAQLKRLPALFGEPDIIKNIQMMPGVISAGEGTSGFFVRGGSADQNLILLDEAPVYDASHFFGLFSVFNADVIKDSELYKGGIPAQFGGRLSSVLDVRTKDGNSKNLAGKINISNLASKISLEAPIIKDKASFLLSARRSYADLFLKLSSDEDIKNNQVYFYDINAKVNWKPTNKDRFFLATYLGRDVLRFGTNARLSWGNNTVTFRWNHLYSERLFSNTTFVFSNFDYGLNINQTAQGFNWTAGLQETSLKQDMTYFLNPKNTLSFGLHASYRNFSPGKVTPADENSIFMAFEMEKMHALDYALYLGNEQHLSDRLSVQYGLRLSLFQNIGKTEIRKYRDQRDNVQIDILEKIQYDNFQTIKTFWNLEPRLSARFKINDQSSIKASYNRMAQYIHLLSNSTVPVPFNTWTPSSPYLNPQLADQVAAGYFQNFKQNTYEFSVEAYYKNLKNITDFADNAQLLLNPDVPVEFRQGDSWSYGLEMMIKKNKGNLTGFLAYTWSKTERQIAGINFDKAYLANYDRRHNFNAVATYDLDDRWTVGGTFTYTTGRPLTLPVGRYEFGDDYNIALYSDRNAYKMPDFHRLDLSFTYNPRKNKTRRWKQEWNFTIYNVYNRKNAFTIYTRTKRNDKGEIEDPNVKEARLVYMFPILPSIAWNLQF